MRLPNESNVKRNPKIVGTNIEILAFGSLGGKNL
jgi:hypothetical protein